MASGSRSILGAALLVAVAVLAAGCASSPDRAPSASASAPVPSGGSDGSGPASDLTGIGGSPVGLAFTQGSVWVAVASSNQLTRLDAATGEILGTFAVGDTPLRLAATPRGIWVSEFKAGTVALVDPATGAISARVKVGAQPEGLASDGKRLWVVLQQESKLVELDAATGAAGRTVRLPAGGEPRLAAYAPAAAGRAATVWVLDFGADRVVPVDAATGKVGSPVAACPGPQALFADGGTLWVACLSGRLVAVDLTTRKVRGSVDLTATDGPPDAVTVSGGKVWVGLSTGPAVLAVDPATMKVTGSSTVGDAGALPNADIDVLVAGGQVWVSSWNEQGVHHDPVGWLGPPP